MDTAAGTEIPHRTAGRRTALYTALAAVAVLAVSASFVPDGLPRFDICPFHRQTGLPCPGCGLTRAFCAISHGRFAAAWHFNPFAFLFYAATLAAPLWAAWKWRNPLRPTPLLQNSRGVVIAAAVLLIAMFTYDAWRICQGWR